MNDITLNLPIALAIILVVAVVAGLLGWLLAHLRQQKRVIELETLLNRERESADTEYDLMQKTFSALATDALKNSNQAFLQLAQQTFKQLHIQARGDLDQKEKAIENLVKPIQEALVKAETQIQAIEKDRKQAYGALHQHLENLSLTQKQLHDETRNLVQALRRPEVRGQWGELTLKRLVELAGMVEYCDFFEQENISSEDGRYRPDMIVRMPAGRDIVVDVKTPLDAYLNAVEAKDEKERLAHLQNHARNVKNRIKELASKAYWNQFTNAPDFAVLFIPGEQFLNAALDVERDLVEFALKQKIILATPTSLVALLRAIAFGWRQEQLAENAGRIRTTGEDLYKRLSVFGEHLSKVGKSLDNAVGHYNRAVGSYDSKLVPGARKLAEMGVNSDKDIEEVEQIEKGVRQIEEANKVL